MESHANPADGPSRRRLDTNEALKAKIARPALPKYVLDLWSQLNPSWQMAGNQVLEEQPIPQFLEIDARTSRLLFEPRDGRVAS